MLLLLALLPAALAQIALGPGVIVYNAEYATASSNGVDYVVGYSEEGTIEKQNVSGWAVRFANSPNVIWPREDAQLSTTQLDMNLGGYMVGEVVYSLEPILFQDGRSIAVGAEGTIIEPAIDAQNFDFKVMFGIGLLPDRRADQVSRNMPVVALPGGFAVGDTAYATEIIRHPNDPTMDIAAGDWGEVLGQGQSSDDLMVKFGNFSGLVRLARLSKSPPAANCGMLPDLQGWWVKDDAAVGSGSAGYRFMVWTQGESYVANHWLQFHQQFADFKNKGTFACDPVTDTFMTVPELFNGPDDDRIVITGVIDADNIMVENRGRFKRLQPHEHPVDIDSPEYNVRTNVCPYLGECDQDIGSISQLQVELTALQDLVTGSIDGTEDRFATIEGIVHDLRIQQEQTETRLAALESQQFRMFEQLEDLANAAPAPVPVDPSMQPSDPVVLPGDDANCAKKGPSTNKKRCFEAGCYWFGKVNECKPAFYPQSDTCREQNKNFPTSVGQHMCSSHYDADGYQCVWDDYVYEHGACHTHNCKSHMAKKGCKRFSHRMDANGMQHRTCYWDQNTEECYDINQLP